MLKNFNIIRKLYKCFTKMSAPYVKLETPLSEHAVVCRGCLADCGEMKDIMEWGLTEDFRKYAGVQLHSSDGVSSLLCSSCEESLMKCKLFQQQCKRSDITLRNFDKNKPKIDLNEISLRFNEKELTFTIIAPDQEKQLNFPCPYNCKDTYSKKSDLLNHLIRTHDHKKDYTIEYHYFCWIQNCAYHRSSSKNKYFTERKNINQHHNKVHKTKIFHCEKCEADFAVIADFNRHHSTCNVVYACEDCDKQYNSKEKLLVHLMRRHPEKHKQYKTARKEEKRKSVRKTSEPIIKKPKLTVENLFETDSPKRSFATQTLNPRDSIKNDVALTSWPNANTEISTQTGFEDLLSLKSNSEDDSLFYSETTLSDIQTQTFPIEFGLFVNRSHKETLTESIDMSIKGTQTCFCFCDTPKVSFESVMSTPSPKSLNLTTSETQTGEIKSVVHSDVLLSLNSTETQTCFEEAFEESL